VIRTSKRHRNEISQAKARLTKSLHDYSDLFLLVARCIHAADLPSSWGVPRAILFVGNFASARVTRIAI
jgi:hypothetical protein